MLCTLCMSKDRRRTVVYVEGTTEHGSKSCRRIRPDDVKDDCDFAGR
jgi:hypothetical protein